ncbi:phosphoglucosamine mutase [Candidatus Bathyarchaeota archaeon]|nr:phosphoglucosamine mutase [Candidatus Bathyarchaeota archaeon]MBS7630992.1 phosphoglucosamine mutase [Candidatus Bathyarchaeota archaeon]
MPLKEGGREYTRATPGDVMGRLFGTNGIRGVVNRDLTVEMVVKLASSAGSILGSRVALGRDGRISSFLFKEAALSGLLSVGCDVFDLGIVPTPVLQYATKHFNLDGGLMITASHNPPEFNGVKVIAGDGVEVSRSVEEKIEGVYFKGGPELASWDHVGETHELHAFEPYCTSILSNIDLEAVRRANLKVAVDPGNGVATLVAPRIAQELGCKTYSVNADVDGMFPSRDSEPRPDNLNDLSALVQATGADLGVAFDGDADRAIFVDEKGRIYWGDVSFALVVKEFLKKHPGEAVATPVSSSRIIKDVVEEGGGSLLWTSVGSVTVSRTMVERSIKLGGEENGGIMYAPHQPVRDGSMAMALILEAMAKEAEPASRLFGKLLRYRQMKAKVPCPEHLKSKVMEKLESSVEAEHIEKIDGIKLWYQDDSWILIRPSGTEPAIRLYAEAKEEARVSKLLENGKKNIEEIISKLSH